jgi:anti-sigma B factor antagonist
VLRFQTSKHHDLMVLALKGRLNSLTVPEIRPEVERVATSGASKVALQLSELNLIDSSGVAVVVSLFKRVRQQGGDMKIVGACGQPEKILDLMGLREAIDLVATLEDAERRFGKGKLTMESKA